jgi:hypothetical protein
MRSIHASNTTPHDQFWARLDTTSSPTGCWLWTGAKDPCGYGNLKRDGRYSKAHRVAYELANGPIPKGVRVLHRCDNPPCCNPDHLFLGSQRDNIVDRNTKGRGNYAVGTGHYLTRLTEDDVREIRRLHAEGTKQSVLAARYNLGRTTLWLIVHRHTWKEVE